MFTISDDHHDDGNQHFSIDDDDHQDATLSTTTTIHLHVEGMMCQRNCGTTVQNALQSLDHGVVQAEAIFAEQRAYVVVDNSGSATLIELQEEAVDAVECVGFDATVIDDIDSYLERLAEQQAAADDDNDDETDGLMVSEPELVDGDSNPNQIVLQVSGMSCAVCTGRVERALTEASGATAQVSVILATSRAVVQLDEESDNLDAVAEACVEAVQRAGYECQRLIAKGSGLRENAQQLEQARTEELHAWRRLLLWSLALTLPIMVLHLGHIQIGTSMTPSGTAWVMFLLSTMVQFGVGRRYYKAAWRGWQSRDLGMDFLICLGTTSSYAYSVTLFAIILWTGRPTSLDPIFMTGPMLLTFVTLGKFLESYARGKTASALQTLMELQPVFASRVYVDSSSTAGLDNAVDETTDLAALETEEVAATEIRVGDYLRVLPGARIPADGVLVAVSASSGQQKDKLQQQLSQAYVDESALTGEPFPVAKAVGDKVFGSTINQLSVLIVKVTATGGATVLSKIVRLVEEAQQNKAPIQAYADRLAGIFAPVVIALATLTFLVWIVFNFTASLEERFFLAFMSAISVVVCACPCALGLATPTAVMVGTGVGATHGLLIKGGAVLESMHSADTIVFDKTGTLTTGRAVLGDSVSFLEQGDPLLEGVPSKVEKDDVALWLATCAETQSEHPLANAITNAAQTRWGGDVTGSSEGVTVTDFRVVPGSGVECLVTKPGWGSAQVRVGSKAWSKESVSSANSSLKVAHEDVVGDKEVKDLRLRGQIAVYVSVLPQQADRRQVVAAFGIVDPIEAEAKSTVLALKQMGIDVWLCTGDHEITAKAVADEIGIDASNVCSGVSPEGKADLVTRLQRRKVRPGHRRSKRQQEQQSRVAMVGDGINDAVALARADVGIAIGAGTEVAVEAADIVLVRSSLHDVVVALHLSQVVFRRIMTNFVWAMSYNTLAIPFAAGILYPITEFRLPPELAGAMMAFSSVSVVASSLLLRNYNRPVVRNDGSLHGDKGLLWQLANILDRVTSCLLCRHIGGRYQTVPSKSEEMDTEVELELV